MQDRIWFWIKSIRWVLIGILIFFVVILPWAANIASKNHMWDYDAYDNYYRYLYTTLPFLCMIPNLMIQKEYVEGGAREILSRDHADIWMSIINTILQQVAFLFLYIWFDDSTGDVTKLWMEIFLIILFMNGMSMLITYITKEPVFTILIALGYTIISNSDKLFELMNVSSMPWTLTMIQEGTDSSCYMEFAMAGVAAWGVAIAISRKRRIL